MVCQNNFILYGLWVFLLNRGDLARLYELKQITRCFTCISVLVPTDVRCSYMKIICLNNDCVDLVSDQRSFDCAPCSVTGHPQSRVDRVETVDSILCSLRSGGGGGSRVVQCSAAARYPVMESAVLAGSAASQTRYPAHQSSVFRLATHLYPRL